MSWTDERVELLKTLWAEGKSASQIAKELGGVTRNAVIGKVHRLGLSNRGTGAAADQGASGSAPAEAEASPATGTAAGPAKGNAPVSTPGSTLGPVPGKTTSDGDVSTGTGPVGRSAFAAPPASAPPSAASARADEDARSGQVVDLAAAKASRTAPPEAAPASAPAGASQRPAADADAATPTAAESGSADALPDDENDPDDLSSSGPGAYARRRIVPAGQPLPPQPSANEVSPEALASVREVEKTARRLTLLELTERTCKWPVGDPATEDFWFCGLPVQPGKPYCEAHVSVAFQPMSNRRDRRR